MTADIIARGLAIEAQQQAAAAQAAALDAQGQAAAAQTTATDAQSQAAAAQTAATDAQSQADAAQATATDAQGQAAAAQTTATDAQSQAAAAQTAATDAQGQAATAQTAATDAQSQAAAAQTAATDAQNQAATAQTTATDAQNQAATAQTAATDAQNQAATAQTTATSAQTAATDAQSGVTALQPLTSALKQKRTRAMLGRALSGNATPGRILAFGDSTVRTPYLNNALAAGGWKLSYPYFLAKKLAALGYHATSNAIVGYGALTNASVPTFAQFDTRVTVNGWGPSGNQSLGGPMFLNASDTTPLSIAFEDAYDTIVVRYRQQSTAGQFTVDVGGAVLQTVTTTGTDGLVTVTIATGAAATVQTLNIRRVSGTVEIAEVEGYQLANPGIIVINAGRGSWSSANWALAQNTWQPAGAIKAIAPDLIIDNNAGVNDVNNLADPSTPINSVTTFTTNKRTVLNLMTSSDVILMTLVPQDPTYSIVANQQAFRQAVIGLGVTYNYPVVDIWSRFVSRSDAASNGLMGDIRHPNPVGHADQSIAVLAQILQ